MDKQKFSHNEPEDAKVSNSSQKNTIKKEEQADSTDSNNILYTKRLEEISDRYTRLQADLENMRKNFEQEKMSLSSYIRSDMLENLLPVMDAFYLSQQFFGDLKPDVRVGLEMISQSFDEFLRKSGIQSYGQEGDTFDSSLYECVRHQNNDHKDMSEKKESPVVSKVVKKGYRIGDRVIRACHVEVI